MNDGARNTGARTVRSASLLLATAAALAQVLAVALGAGLGQAREVFALGGAAFAFLLLYCALGGFR